MTDREKEGIELIRKNLRRIDAVLTSLGMHYITLRADMDYFFPEEGDHVDADVHE